MSDGIRLIVNADDFGMSRGITDAIVVAHRYGFLTSTSLMVNMRAVDYAVSRAPAFPALAIGVHLNICQGRPLLPARDVRTLVDDNGEFYSPREMAVRLWTWRVAPAEIEREFRAQIRWMKERGFAPSHADSHHHMHIYPAAARAFVRALAAEGIACARACRCIELPKRNVLGGPYGGVLLRRLVVQSYRSTLHRTIFRRLVSPDYRIAISGASSDGATTLQERWKAALGNLQQGTFELACHPGLFERDFSENDSIRDRREAELLCLTNRDLRDVIDRRAIRLISYRDLIGSQAVGQKASAAAA